MRDSLSETVSNLNRPGPAQSRPGSTILVTAVPTWSIGDVIAVGRGEQFRVVAIDDFPQSELVEQDVPAMFTVERFNWSLALPGQTRILGVTWVSPGARFRHGRHT